MMLYGMLIMLYTGVPQMQILNRSCLESIQQHGFTDSKEDIAKAIDFAFDHEDSILLDSICCYNGGMRQMDLFADQITQRFLKHPETAFRKSAMQWYFITLSEAPRILLSKQACNAYWMACGVFSSPKPDYSCKSAFKIIGPLAEDSGISFRDLLVKLALTMPVSPGMFKEKAFSTIMQSQCKSLTPEMAFYISQRYKEEKYFQPLKAIFEEQAGELLVGEKQPAITLEDLLKDLEKGIAEYGRLICEKYKDIEPGPYVPPKEKPTMGFGPFEPVL